MNALKENTAPYFFKTWKLLGLAALFLLVNEVGYAQNTKGAEVKRGSSPKRENRFRILPKKKKQKSGSGGTFKRVQGRPSSANSARKMPSTKPRKIYSQSGRSVNYSSKSDKQKAWKGDITGRKIRAPRSGDKARKVYPQYGRYVNTPSKNTEPRVTSNRSTVSRLNRLQRSHAKTSSGGRKQTVIPRSASHAFIARKSINVYANFARPKPKKEKAHIKDITGRRLRTKNFETPRPEVSMPTYKPSSGRKRAGDQVYRGKASGSHQSAIRKSERAWKGNISGHKIRGRNYSSKPRVEGSPIFPNKNRRPQGNDRVYRGSMPPSSGYRSATRSGESRKGNGPIPVRTPGRKAARVGSYQGSLKLFGRSNPGYSDQGEGFTGYKKSSRPVKGGGSVSGRLWNNRSSAIPVRTPKPSAARAGKYQGSLKLLGKSNPGFSDQGEGFTGYKKAKRPLKGGGSVSGKLWNNKEKAIAVRTPPPAARRAGTFQGNAKLFEQNPTLQDQGEEFTGFIKLRKFKRNYVKNPNAADASLKKKYQSKSTFLVDGLQIKVKQREYGKKPHAVEGSMPGVKPSKSSVKASEYASGVKRTWKYIHNPSSADEAQRTREPGKAFGRSTDYQGNIKMQKFHLFEKNRQLHPDATFVKTNKNNVDGERDILTNVKLWWAKLFKKQDTQPDNLKDKGKKPRYDKREDGLWYD